MNPCFHHPLPEWIAAPLLGIGAFVSLLACACGALLVCYGLISLAILLIQETLRRTGSLKLVIRSMRRVHAEIEAEKKARKEQGRLEL